nr:MAG TPA: hypothetical protein [Caudoviricetes sp.]
MLLFSGAVNLFFYKNRVLFLSLLLLQKRYTSFVQELIFHYYNQLL